MIVNSFLNDFFSYPMTMPRKFDKTFDKSMIDNLFSYFNQFNSANVSNFIFKLEVNKILQARIHRLNFKLPLS